VIKAEFGDRLDGWIHTVFPFLFTRPLNPNVLTLVGTAISAGAATAFALGEFRFGGVLLLAGGFFDLVDGVVARHNGTSSSFGGFLDSTMDRLVDMVVFFGLVVYFGQTGQVGLVLLTGVVLIASVMTSYAKARAEQTIEVLEGGIFERGERVGVLAAGAILGFVPIALWILAAGTLYTVAQRFQTAYRAMESLDAITREAAGEHS
jgi:phosphatidylglycerophosphate synthase